MEDIPALSLCGRDKCNRLAGHTGRCNQFTTEPLRGLPEEITNKIGKTSQTRGAQPPEGVPYQNRVRRWNHAVIRGRTYWKVEPPGGYENGSIILISPREYFNPKTKLRKVDLPEWMKVGENAFVYYEDRKDWKEFPPEDQGWSPRTIVGGGDREPGSKDKGHYLARIPARTSEGEAGEQIVKGDVQGIRFWEYCSHEEAWEVMMQLADLAWKKREKEKEVTSDEESAQSRTHLDLVLKRHNLSDDKKLEKIGALRRDKTCCPLCVKPILARELMERTSQLEGRETVDLTVTDANLFHLRDLKPGEFNHRAYQVAWGHYICNTAARDRGIQKTLDWMEEVLKAQGRLRTPVPLVTRQSPN